jgi:cyclophilin family peptidyl-prolyl cis-trans isomerase
MLNGSDPQYPHTHTCAQQQVEVSLYDGIAPRAVENFKNLCAGSNGVAYKGSNVYRVLKDYSIQAGDIGSKKRGATGTSSFSGEPFPIEPEALRVRHSLEGMVSMVGVGKVDSRFFFNLGQDSSWADGRYVVVGRVTKGLGVLKELEKVDVRTPSNNPIKPIVISDAGVL